MADVQSLSGEITGLESAMNDLLGMGASLAGKGMVLGSVASLARDAKPGEDPELRVFKSVFGGLLGGFMSGGLGGLFDAAAGSVAGDMAGGALALPTLDAPGLDAASMASTVRNIQTLGLPGGF